MKKALPVIDLHCDLLSYLLMAENATIHSKGPIGASLPYLKAGNVQTQVCAIFTFTKMGSTNFASDQAEVFQELAVNEHFYAAHLVPSRGEADTRIGIIPAIENASGLLEEDEDIDLLELRLNQMIKKIGNPLYISFTHHLANRFGGGNFSENLPITSDGKELLGLLDGKKICVDLSHTSDALAEGILTEIDKQRYDIPVIASHSNFRSIRDHVRNLTDEFVEEIIHRKGLIGLNFVREFLDPSDPEGFFHHVEYAIDDLGAEDVLAFGADFFDEDFITDEARHPIFFPEHKNASKYPTLLRGIKNKLKYGDLLEKIAHKNVQDFLERMK